MLTPASNGKSLARVGFQARMVTPASADCAFEVAGRLTPYEVETLAMNAQSYPHGSCLELILDHADALILATLGDCFAGLAARGIEVIVRPVEPDVPALHLPLVSAPAARDPERAVRKRRVLVAEDDPEMRRLLATFLRMAGHKVVEASDGTEILTRMESTIWSERRDLFDVIVSDINMPGLSGLDFLAALRCTQWTTPVILITAFGDEETRAEARELGAAALLDKPLDPEALRRAVAEVAEGATMT